MKFYDKYLKELEHRANGFKLMFDRLEDIASPNIVETGCMRKDAIWGDGNSTLLFSEFLASVESPERVTSIDIDPNHINFARERCKNAYLICGDSVKALHSLSRSFTKPIDLLYLDSFDIDWSNPHPSALHHLKELCAAAPMLKPGSMIWVDDNDKSRGKGMYVKEYMKDIGGELIFDEYQIGFVYPG